MQTICTSLQTDNHTTTSSLNFYRPDALPDAQPTVSNGKVPFCIWHKGSKFEAHNTYTDSNTSDVSVKPNSRLPIVSNMPFHDTCESVKINKINDFSVFFE